MRSSDRPVRIFYCYSPRDVELREKLEAHLALLRRSGHIFAWHEQCLEPGMDWQAQAAQKLEQADVILLLVSADLVASDYHYDVEIKRAIERHQRGEARVIPVLLRPVDLQNAPFADLAVLPVGGKPVTAWTNQDQAWENIASELRRSIAGGQQAPWWHSRAVRLGLGLPALGLLGLLAIGALSSRRPQPAVRALPVESVVLPAGECGAAPRRENRTSPAQVRLVGVRWLEDFSPRFDLTLRNDGDEPAVLLALLVDVESCDPQRSIAESRVLSPLATFELGLRCEPGCVSYALPAPIQIAAKDAVVVRTRLAALLGSAEHLQVTDPFLEDGYRLRFGLRTDKAVNFFPQAFDTIDLYRRVASRYCPTLLAVGGDDRQHSEVVKLLCR